MTSSVRRSKAASGCTALATSKHADCSRCAREHKIAALRNSPPITGRLLVFLLKHTPHHDLESG